MSNSSYLSTIADGEQLSIDAFGLAQIDKDRIEELEAAANKNELGIAWLDRVLPEDDGLVSELLGFLLLYTVLWPFLLVGLLLTPLLQAIAQTRLLRESRYPNYQAYRDALLQREKSKRDYWLSLSGVSFEHNLADLYSRLGFSMRFTKSSGDDRIDIILIHDTKRIVVQCKQHCKPVGRAIARELYGAMIASNANAAVLACTSGFTDGVYEFVRDKPIELVDLETIVRMQESLNKGLTHGCR